ncbi:hypothetical protein [Endothiovibrio diazotrophicus]
MTQPDRDPSHLHLKTSLDHLPEAKRHQLRRITECICQSVPLDRLVLFGSQEPAGQWGIESREREGGPGFSKMGGE